MPCSRYMGSDPLKNIKIRHIKVEEKLPSINITEVFIPKKKRKPNKIRDRTTKKLILAITPNPRIAPIR
jgi:hypothetical protein